MSQFDIDMTNAEKEYNKLMNMPTITGNSVIDDILNTDSASPVIKKLVNTTYSAETKEAILKQRTLEKMLDMDGYKKVKAVLTDGDSGYWEDETGKHEFRLSDFNRIDTVDKLNAINNNMYKSIHQPSYVSRLTGKPVDLLTEEDYANVSNYQARQVHNSFADPNYQIEKYNPDIRYDVLEKTPVEIAIKNVGTDTYGRSLVEAINPTTGRQVSFDMSNNPFLNANFDLYESLDTSSNRNKLENYLQSQKLKEIYKEKAKDAFDYDNRLEEDLDIIQSNALQSASRVLKKLPSFLVDKKYWESLADPETGQVLADAITGVKSSTREDYTKAMNSALDNIKQGNYAEGIFDVVTQFDRLLADSAVQTGLMFAGGGLGKVAGTALGLSEKIATTVSVLSAGMLASADQTLINIEEYKKNNGTDMPVEDVIINFLGNTALMIPDYLLVKSGITKLFSGKFKSSAIKEAITDIGKSTVSEGLQEMTQDTFNEYMTQDQSNPNSIIDIFTSPEQQLSGIAGGVMGGGLSVVPNTVSGIRGTRTENKNNNIRNQIIENNQTTTPINTESDKTISDNVKNYVSTIDSSTFKSDEDFISTIKTLEGLVGSDSKLDKDTIELVQKKSKDLIKEKLLSETDETNRENFLKALGKTKEEIFEEEVYFSDLNAEKQFIRTGKQLTNEAKEQIKKDLLDFASKIGVSKEFATKTMSEVATQVKFGWNGYKTYEAALRNINERLSDTNLSEEERIKLQKDKDAWTFQLIRLFNSQSNKLVQFADAADKIASGDARDVTFRYDRNTGKFTLYGSHLANHTYESGYTAYGIVQDIYNTTTSIKNILKENLSDKELQTFLNKYSDSIDFNKDDVALNTFKNASTNIRKGIKASIKAKLDKKNKSFSDSELIARLDRLSKGMTKRDKEVEFTNDIRNASSEQLESIRTSISNSTRKNKSELLSKLDEIINLDKTTEQEFDKIQKESKVVLDESNKIEAKYTDEYINSLDSTNINSASREIRDIATKLAITTTKESKEALERIKKIKNKVDNKNKELKRKQFEEIQKSIDSTEKNPSIITPTSLKETTVYKAIDKFIETQGKNPSTNNGIIAYRANADITKKANNKGIVVIGNPFNWTDKKYGSDRKEAEKIVTNLFERWIKGDLNNEVGYSADNVIKSVFLNRYSNIFYYTDDAPINHAAVLQDLQTFLRDNVKSNEWNDSIITLVHNNFRSRFNSTSEFTNSTQETNANEFVNHSGGAIGSDTYWGEIGNKYGITTNHYYLGEKTPNGNIEISKEDSIEGKEKVTKAAIQMGRLNPNHTIKNALLIRSWAQVKYADAIFAITTLLQAGDKIDSIRVAKIPQGKGGTGYAIQMAINEGKPVYIYDQEKDQWFTYKDNSWIKTDTPILTKNFAGIGTRKLNEKGKRAIEAVFNKTFNTLNDKNESNIEDTTNVSDTEEQTKKDNSTVIKSDIEEAINNNESIASDTTTEVVISNNIADTDTETEIASVEESKVMAVSTLLDGKINISATLAPYGFKFNLADELSITKNPQSTLAIDGITEDTKEMLKPIKNIANRIKFRLNGLSNVKSPAALFLSSGGTIENVKKSILYNAPHLRLLYKIIPTKSTNGKKSFNFEFNDLVLVAVDLAAKEFLSSSNLDKLTNPKTRHDIASIFNLNESTMSNDLYQELRRFVKEYGIPRTVLAERIGSLVMKNLGLAKNTKTGTKGFYEKTVSGLGLFALDYIIELGYLTKDRFNAEEYSKKIKQEYNVDIKHPLTNNDAITTINTVKRTKKSLEPILNNFLGKKVKIDGKIVRQDGLKDKYKIEDNSVRGPRITKNKLPRNMKVRNTNGMSDIPAFEKKTLNKLWNTPYTINLDLVRFILNNLKDVKDRLGIVPESTIEQLAKDTAVSSEGVNLSIESQLNYLFKYAAYQQKNNNNWYFNWFMSRNGRLFIDSNTINPQTSKIQRFLMLPNDLYRDFDPNSEFNKRMESFAIAQAFDSLGTNEDIEALGKAINDLSIEQLSTMMKDLVKLNEKEFSKKYSNLYTNHKGEKTGLDGIENFGQCLVVLQHLINKKKANGKSFKTWLAVENDSTTSGYFIRFMAFPDPEILEKFGEKVGIINMNSATPKTEIHELKKTEGFNDIYQTMALGTAQELPIISNEKEKRISELRQKIKEIEENKTINYEHPIWNRKNRKNRKQDTIYNMSSDTLESFITYIKPTNKISLHIDRQINKNKKTIILTLKNTEKDYIKGDTITIIKFTTSKNNVIVNISVIDPETNKDITNDRFIPNYLNELHNVFTHYVEDNNPTKKIKLQYEAYKEELNELLNSSSDFQLEFLYSNIVNKTGFLIEPLVNTFKLMYKALPKPNEDGTVSKALRTLQKGPAMTYGYSAGKKSISEALSQELLLTFVNTFIDIQNKGGLNNYLKGVKENQKEEIKAIYNTMEYISSLYKKDIKTLERDIKNKSLSEIWLKVGDKNITLSNFFNKVLAPTYGEAVYNALDRNFESYREYNNNMNQMFAIMYQLFTTIYNKEMETLAEEYPLGIPLKEEQKVIKKLSSLYPSLRLLYSDSLSEGILLLNTEKSRSKDNKVSNPIIENNKLVQETTSTNIRTFSNVGSSGSVVPIHYMDGMGMLLSLNNNPNIIPIHDAKVMSALDAIEEVRKYNEDMYLVAKEYNLYEELYNRTMQAIEEYNKLIKDYPDLDNTSNIIVRDSRNRKNDKDKTIDEIMKEISKSVIENNRHRDNFFYLQNHFIANMDGPQDSGVEINPFNSLPEKKFKEAIDEYRDYSSPYGYQTDGEIRETLQNAVDDVEARIKLFDNLQDLAEEYGNKVEDEKHIEHLKSILRKINPKYLKDLIIQISTNREANAGMLEDNSVVIGFDGSKKDLDESTRNAPYGQSLAEIYAHELIHAGTRFALANKDSLNLNDIVNKILEIQKKSGDVITWEDLMPDNYDPKLQSVYEQYAKDIIEYIFNNPKGNLKGVAEFIAYGLTNEKIINKLKNTPLIEKKDYSNTTLFNRLVDLAKTILDVAFGKIKFSEGFSELTNIILGNKSIRYRNNLYSELELLTTKLSYANRKTANKLMQHPMKLVEQMFKIVVDLTRKGNNFLSPKLRYLTNMLDIQGKTMIWKTELTDNWLTDTKKLINVLAGFAFSQTRRNVFASWLADVAGISQQGTLLSIYRDISSIDNQTNRLDNIITLTRLVEQSSKGIESTVYTNLIKGFDRQLTNEENIAITISCLFTDLQSLLNSDDSNIEEIKSLLSNKENINKKIEEINKKLMHDENYLWYRNQAFGLARFMTTGIGNEVQNFNAKNIAEGKLLGKDIKASDYTIKLIDQLATLYALSFTEDTNNKLIANLDSKGLLNLLKVHKQFVKESTEGIKTVDKDGNIQTTNIVSDIHTIKGYTKQILDPSFDITVDLIDNKEELAKSGYKLIRKLNENEITKNSGLAIYRRTFANVAHRDGSGFIISGANAIGTALKDTAYRLYRNIDPEDKVAPIRTWEIYTKNAEVINKKLKKAMLTKKLTMEDFNNISQGYSPIINPDTGMVSDYRITMSNEHKISDLNMEMDGLTILSKMYASQNTKLNASGRNRILVEFLRDDMKTNMNPTSKRDLDNNKYILITENTNNKFLKEAWKILPKELLDAAKEEDFYIREDWLQRLFGTPNISLNDIAIIHNRANRYIKRFISMAEYVIKIVASLAKTNILLKVPGVLIGNIISNINYSIMTGTNPAKVIRKTIENYKATKDYIETRKALNAILFKERIGTATKRELQLKNWYKSKLENNIVHPLMEKGMYQAIIEDSNVTDIESISRLHKAINNNKIINKLPKSIKQIGKQLYITEGTFIYDFMQQMTQFSDFASRATEYQLQMEKAPEKYTTIKKDGKTIRRLNDNWIKYEEKVTKDVWEAFINYDIPQSALMQYLNDMGILMFTKYAFRIQKVIAKNILDNPMGVLMFMLGQSYIMNTEDIMEQNIFNKHWSALLHNPLENFIDVAIPMPLQYYYGMRNTGI